MGLCTMLPLLVKGVKIRNKLYISCFPIFKSAQKLPSFVSNVRFFFKHNYRNFSFCDKRFGEVPSDMLAEYLVVSFERDSNHISTYV